MDIPTDVKIAHFLPGRVRLKVAAAKNNPAYAGPVRDAFLAVPGIESIEVNSITGSVLIHYDSQRLLADDALAALTTVLRRQFPSLDTDEVQRWLKAAHF
jgi:hypothetical protein